MTVEQAVDPCIELLRSHCEDVVRMRLQGCTSGYIADKLRERGNDVSYATVYRACGYIDMYDPDDAECPDADVEHEALWVRLPLEERVPFVLDGVRGVLEWRWGKHSDKLPAPEPRTSMLARLRAAVEEAEAGR